MDLHNATDGTADARYSQELLWATREGSSLSLCFLFGGVAVTRPKVSRWSFIDEETQVKKV